MKLLNLFNHKKKDVFDIKSEILKERKRDIKDLKKVNKKIQLLLKDGSIEVIIKNVKGVVKEL